MIIISFSMRKYNIYFTLIVLAVLAFIYFFVWDTEPVPIDSTTSNQTVYISPSEVDTFDIPQPTSLGKPLASIYAPIRGWHKYTSIQLLKFYIKGQKYADAKKYGFYLSSASRYSSKSKWQCAKNGFLRAPCSYYICDYKVGLLKPVDTKPIKSSKCSGGYCCAFIAYPWATS
jgi:hypothetical protein